MSSYNLLKNIFYVEDILYPRSAWWYIVLSYSGLSWPHHLSQWRSGVQWHHHPQSWGLHGYLYQWRRKEFLNGGSIIIVFWMEKSVPIWFYLTWRDGAPAPGAPPSYATVYTPVPLATRWLDWQWGLVLLLDGALEILVCTGEGCMTLCVKCCWTDVKWVPPQLSVLTELTLINGIVLNSSLYEVGEGVAKYIN